ncbi:MAG: hypothetical protein WC732_03070 [Candidatus Omnitrophota bacterium]
MKKLEGLMILFLAAMLVGCSPQFWGGTGAGVVGTGAGYEINAKRQKDRLDKELAEGQMNQTEYDIRVDQVKRDSLLQ